MRRYLILFLLVLMPLQLSWAAAGSYCGHETGPQANHFGHHPHEHAAGDAPDLDAGTPDKQSSAPHPDCGTCHGGNLVVLSNEGPSTFVTSAASRFVPPWDRISSSLTYPPERPKWASLA